ncbi:MAG: glycosyltransferase, partial [FCB group bacterium]
MYIEKSKTLPPFSVEYYPFVSVVIPSRNEEHNIEACINSISQNNYPIDKYEIIAVNDRSTDNTLGILRQLSNVHVNLKIVNITENNKNKNLTGKPGALQAGINTANGEIILMTDADCVVNQNWIKSLVNTYYDSSVGLTASFTNINGKNIFENFQALEWIY